MTTSGRKPIEQTAASRTGNRHNVEDVFFEPQLFESFEYVAEHLGITVTDLRHRTVDVIRRHWAAAVVEQLGS